MADSGEAPASAPVHAPRAAGIAGIAFSLLLITSLVLTRSSVPADPSQSPLWLHRSAATFELALTLLPFAGLAFLWFVGVVRDHLGAREDRFFATVFLGSGLLFVATLFVAAAASGGILMAYASVPGAMSDSGTYAFARTFCYLLINVYAMKMAAAFMISTATLSVRTGAFPRWVALLGYALAVVALLSSSRLYWAPIAFPCWVLLVSVYILFSKFRGAPAEAQA